MNTQSSSNMSQLWLSLLGPSDPSVRLGDLGRIEKAIARKCNEEQMSKETQGFTQINGETLPGRLLPGQKSQVLLDIVNAEGQRVLIVKAIRKAGTRVGIHFHRYGGYTLILKGTMTDYVQGLPVKSYGPQSDESGYYMPPCTPMSAANLGKEDVEYIDIFIGPLGEPYIEIEEPEWKYPRVGRFDN